MLGSEFQFQREAGGGEKESSAMSTPPEEDAFFLKFLLTVTAAAVAETGEAIVSCILVWHRKLQALLVFIATHVIVERA